MPVDTLITDLKKQSELLEDLIAHLRGKERLNAVDLSVYDQITRRIEKKLRVIRKSIVEKSEQRNQPQGES